MEPSDLLIKRVMINLSVPLTDNPILTTSTILRPSPSPRPDIQLLNALAIIYSILAITGSVSNLLIIIGITSCKLLWKPTYFYILNVAVSDFLICAICCPFNVFALLYRREPVGCAVAGLLVNVFMLASLMSLSTVALNRYMLVKLSIDKYRAHFDCSRIWISTAVIWALSFMCLLPLAIHGSPGYDTNYSICLSSPNGTNSVFDTIQALLLGFPSLFLIYFCYVQIWRIFRSSVQSTELPANKRAVSSLKLTRNLFIVTTLYTICWMPNFFLMIFDYVLRAPTIIQQFASVFAIMHCTINPITYLLLNRNLASAYYGIFTCFRRNSNIKCCGCVVYSLRGQAIPSPSTTMETRNPLRRISRTVQRLRTASTILRKISDPGPTSGRPRTNTEPVRKLSEPPPQRRRLSIVTETLRSPTSNASTRTRRTHVSLDSPPIITVTEFQGSFGQVLEGREVAGGGGGEAVHGRELEVPDSPGYNERMPLEGATLGPVSETSTSDSGCEIIPLEPIQTTRSVHAEIHQMRPLS